MFLYFSYFIFCYDNEGIFCMMSPSGFPAVIWNLDFGIHSSPSSVVLQPEVTIFGRNGGAVECHLTPDWVKQELFID